MLSARADGQDAQAVDLWAELKRFVQENEDALQPVFDVYEFVDRYNRYNKGGST